MSLPAHHCSFEVSCTGRFQPALLRHSPQDAGLGRGGPHQQLGGLVGGPAGGQDPLGWRRTSFIVLIGAAGQAFRRGRGECSWSLLCEACGLCWEDWEAGGHLLARLWSHVRACPTLLPSRRCCPLPRAPAGTLGPAPLCGPLRVAWASLHHGCLGEAVFPVWGLSAPKAGVLANKGETAWPLRTQPQKSHGVTFC